MYIYYGTVAFSSFSVFLTVVYFKFWILLTVFLFVVMLSLGKFSNNLMFQ